MAIEITGQMAAAAGLAPGDVPVVRDLVDEWASHRRRNALRDSYYSSHVRVKDLGVSVSPELARKLDPSVDWAAKCVDWWADRVQYEGVTCQDEGTQEALSSVLERNDGRNLVHRVASSALRHSCAFMAVTQGDHDRGEPSTVVSGYPATAASAIWDEAAKRIRAGLVIVACERRAHGRYRRPTMAYVLTDTDVIVLTRQAAGWVAEYRPHGMGRVPMVHVAYHPTLERPFGRSRITRTVMSLVDDAQREMENMTAAAAFAAAPQKYLTNVSPEAARKIADSPFAAYIGSVLAVTSGKPGSPATVGQLAQLTMQPHVDYMRALAAQFSGATGVPLSSLGVVSDNPSSAEAIYAAKEDAVVDIQAYVDGLKRSLRDVCYMVLASEDGHASFYDELDAAPGVMIHFANPAMPSIVSQSDAMVKQVSAIPWLADSDVTLRELGYTDEQITQLRSDRRRSQAMTGVGTILGTDGGGGGGDIGGGAAALQAGAAQGAG